MRKTEKKKLTLKKINIASMEELKSIKGKSAVETNTCSVTCSGKTHPVFSVIILVCLESIINC
ncbi:MAG: hypothetical protein AB8B65_10555 [Kordia sp.]|uniref:hypothetical protein n=1 Tax=Kordia sp. TaxID=1965332 RepID=UPI00385E27FC